MMEKPKVALEFLMWAFFALFFLYVTIAHLVISMKHPEFTGVQRVIKMFVWDYEEGLY